jgi:two-component system chemotaxis response regulator CheB
VVADDSAVIRRVVVDALSTVDIEVVGCAVDGEEAIEMCRRLTPDVLTLDLSMPGIDGTEVLRRLRAEQLDVRVVVVAATDTRGGAELAVGVLASGAADAVLKPSGGTTLEEFCEELVTKVQLQGMASTWSPVERVAAPEAPAPDPLRAVQNEVEAPEPVRHARPWSVSDGRLLVIASSTGGPRGLADLIPAIELSEQCAGIIVQHMPRSFTGALARRLDSGSQTPVAEATDGSILTAGGFVVAPGDSHLRISRGGRLRLEDGPPIGGVRPRADLTIDDAVALAGSRVTLLVLSGMGNDGLAGARAVREAGGKVFAQAEEECAVFGMPRQVIEAGLADEVGGIARLAELSHAALSMRRKAS